MVVPDYDEAIAYFCGVLGFELVEDTPLEGDKRWVLMRPSGPTGTAILLARAGSAAEHARIGDQAGGRVFLFLHTDDFAADHTRYAAAGVRFVEAPEESPTGRSPFSRTLSATAGISSNRASRTDRHPPATRYVPTVPVKTSRPASGSSLSNGVTPAQPLETAGAAHDLPHTALNRLGW